MDEAVTSECKDQNKEELLLTPNVKGPENQQKEISSEGKKDDDKGNIFEIFQTAEVGPETTAPNTSSSKPEINDVLEIEAPNDDFDEEMETSHIAETEYDSVQEDTASKKISGPTPEQLSKLQELVQSMAKPGPKTEQIEKEKKKTAAKKPSLLTKAFKQALMTKKQNVETARATAILKSIKERAKESVKAKVQPELQIKKPSVPIEDAYEAEAYENEEFEVAKPGALPKVSKPVILFKPPPMDLNNAKDVRERYHQALVNKEIIVPPIPEIGYHTNYENRQRQKMEEGDVLVLHDLFYKKKIVGKTGAIIDSDLTDITVVESLKLFVQFTGKICEDSDVVQQKNDFLNYVLSPFKDQTKKFNDSHLSALSPIVNSLYKNRKARKPSMKPSRKRKIRVLKQVKKVAIKKIILPQLQSKAPQQVKDLAKPVIQDTHIPVSGVKDQKQVVDQVPKVKQQLPTEEHHIPTGIKPITEEQTQSGDLKHIETEVSMEKKVKLTEVPNESVKDIQSENTEKTTLEIKIANEEQLIKEQEELTLEQEELIARLTKKSIFLPTDSKEALPQIQSVEPSKRKQDDQFGDDRKKPKMDIPVDKSIESMNDDAVVPPLKPGLSRERSDSPKPKDRKRKKIEKMDEMSSKVIAGLVDEIDDEHHLESKQSTDDAKKRKMEEDSGTENLPKITEAKADVRMEVDALPDISKAVASRSPVKTANIPLPVPRAAELMQKSDALKQSESTVEQPKTMEPTNVDKPVSRWDKVTKKPIVLEIGKPTDLSKKTQIVEKIVAVKTKEKSASPEKEETSVSKIPQFIIQKVSQPVVNPGTIGCFPYPSASPATKEPKSDPAPNIPVPSYYDTSISGQYSTTLSYTTSAGAPSGEAVKPDSTSKTSTAKPFFIGKMKKFSSAKETADATKAGEKAETVAENEAPPPPPPEDKLDAPVPPIPEPPPPLPEDIPKPTQYSSKPVAYSSKPVAYTTSQSSVKPPEPPPAKISLSTLDSATEEAVNQQAANAKAWQEYWKKQQDGTPASSSETEAGATPWTAEQQQWASQYGYDQYNQYSQGDQQGNWQNYWYGQGYNYPQGGSGYDQYSDPNQCQGGPPPGPWMGIEGHPPPPPFGAPPPPWGMPPPPWGQWGPPPPQGQWGEGYNNDYEQDNRPSGDWMPTAERMKDLKVTKVSPRDGTCMYVHNKDKAKCKSVHRFLLFMGAKDFDPYSPTLLKAIRKVEAIVLIHKDDKDLIHTVPNLVQLKQDPGIQFLSYNDVIDVKEKSYLPILEKGGIAMLDNEVLFSTPPESLQTLCDYFESQTWKEGTNWCIKVHAHTMLKLQKLKMDSNPAMAAANKHAEETLAIIKLYKDVGVVDIMVKHDCDKHRKSYLEAQDYLHCYTHIQNENIKIARHHILISDIDPSSVSGQMFLHNGIDIQTFSSFCKKYAKLDVLVLPQSVQGPSGVDHPLYRAALLSSGTEQLLSPYTPDESSMAEALPLLPPGTSPPRDTPHLKPPPMRPPPKIPSLFEIRPQGSEMDTAQSDSPSQDSWHTGPRGPPQSQVSPHHSTRGPPGQESGEGRFNVPPPHGGHGSQVSPPGGSRPPPANGPRGPPPSHSDPWGPPLNQSGPRGPPPNQSVHRGPSPSQSGPRGPPSNQSGPRGPPPSQSGPPPSQSGPPPSQFGPRGPPPSELDHKGPPPSQYGPRGPSPKSLTGANMTPITPNVGPRGALSGGIRPQTSSLLKGATTEGPRLTPLASRGFKSMAKPAAKPYTPPVEEPKPVELEDPLDNLPPVQSMPTPPIRMKVSKGATMPFKLKFPFGNVEEEPLPPGIAPERQGTGGSMIPPPPKQHPFSSIKEVPPIRPTQEVETQGAEEQTKEVPQQASGEKKLESIQEKMLRMISK
ncbi:unnamed protein product [Owenia fusiformis]|uniref:Uncharacterized protein n=1 Tax=Owenia fusiformis TaxID=6347 RepID=A0A8J1T436_OWEFU|nr:unnamed protein product [Owenia fusiformis]